MKKLFLLLVLSMFIFSCKQQEKTYSTKKKQSSIISDIGDKSKKIIDNISDEYKDISKKKKKHRIKQ